MKRRKGRRREVRRQLIPLPVNTFTPAWPSDGSNFPVVSNKALRNIPCHGHGRHKSAIGSVLVRLSAVRTP